MNEQAPDIENEGGWGPDGLADVLATLAVLAILVTSALVFVAGA